MGPFLALLLKPKVLIGTLVTIFVLSAFLWYGHSRQQAGYQEGTRVQLEVDRKQFEQALGQYKDALAKAQSVIDASNAKIASLDSQVQTLQIQYAALAAQRRQGQENINKLPDSAVQGDLETKLGGPLSDAAILRKADAIVTDYPLVLKQVDILTDKVDKLDQKFNALSEKEQAVEKQRDAAMQFVDVVVPLYTKAYNAAQVHHSKFIKIITLGLVRDRHLDLPAPASLNVPKVS
jgi:outer membrane murein-binding lipoprotein Lpp